VRGAGPRFRYQCEQVLIEDGFSAIGEINKAPVKGVQVEGIEFHAEFLQPLRERRSAGMLAKDEAVSGSPDRRRVQDFVGEGVGEHSVLMNAGFVGKCVSAHHGLVRRRSEADDLRKQPAGGAETIEDQRVRAGKFILAHEQGRGNLFQGGVCLRR